jgi:ubiquinone/menaquinone biosynthesis C-methylase UbiE
MSSPAWQEPYDAHAASYARFLDPTLAGAVERLVELAGARPGMRLLDLATGTGTAAQAAAKRGASVVGIDLSPGMLEVARGRSPEIDFRLADACALPVDGGAFDAVTCGLCLSHFGEREKALREVLRVLRKEGLFVASTWGEGGSDPTAPVGEILERYAGAVEGLDEETWLSPERGREILREAGFASVSVETELFTGSFGDAEEALAWSLAWPLSATRLGRLDSRRCQRFLADAREAIANSDLSWNFAFNFFVACRPEVRGRS